MATIFRRLFGCCLGSRPRSKRSVPDEESRLIPAESTDPIPAAPNVVVIDHQKLKAKLGTIVRSKEGKMVNVNAQIPFNLHNQTLSHTLDPSSSRSASLHRYEFPQGSQRPAIQSQLFSSSRAPSVSSDLSALHDSRRGSLAPSENETERRSPILDIRLVKSYGSIDTTPTPTRTGRPRTRGGDDKGKSLEIDVPEDLEGKTPTAATHDVVTPRQTTHGARAPFGLNLDLSSRPLPTPEFKIDASSITLSWD
ncbi:hypothetical protein C8J56DRAFT_1161937 [Mycena floridula]|nr:hypothetical protein C8J56DRAFT_1161937 [Mycena floridula]